MIAPLGNRLKGLVIAGALATPYAEQKPLDRRRLAAAIECGGPESAAVEYLPKLLGWTSKRANPSLFARLQEIVWENSRDGIATALRAIADRPDFSSLLPEIRCPTLCIAGAEDPLTPPEQVRDMAQRIPVAQVATIAGAGHLVNLEAPEAFNRELQQFLSSLSTMDTPPGVDYNGVSRDETS
jgi:pimeloyl-ACP methyl ester carboxylesterase